MSPSTVHWQALRRLDRDNTPAPGCKALAVAGQLPTCGLAPCALRGLGQALASLVRVGVTAVAGVVPLIGTGRAPGYLGGRRKRRLGPAAAAGRQVKSDTNFRVHAGTLRAEARVNLKRPPPLARTRESLRVRQRT